MATFKISARSNGEFQFALTADNGQVILNSEGYSTKAGCLNGVDSVRKNSQSQENFESKTAANGKQYFVLKAGNGQVIGTSQMYADEAGRSNGIASVIKNAHNAQLDEQIA